MIKFAVLGSGSKGNAVYFSVDGYQFLIDCGFSKKETTARLANFGKSLDDIKAMYFTHLHGDHQAAWVKKSQFVDCWSNHKPFIDRFAVHHDIESFGYCITDGVGNKIALIADTGCIPEESLPFLFDCQVILIECNYDVDTLIAGRYSTEQQERIASDSGHLMNEDAAATVACVAWSGLRHVVALHLSENNNKKELVDFCLRAALCNHPGCTIDTAEQGRPGKLYTIL